MSSKALLALSLAILSVKVGQTEALKATNPSDESVAFESSDPSVAAVNSTGVVRGVRAGKATITARAGGQSATCEVTVTE